MHANSIFKGINCSSTADMEAFFVALVEAIALARKGEAENLVHKNEDDHFNKKVGRKLRIFKDKGLFSITLTKNKFGAQQLRGWIGCSQLQFWSDGQHVDEYGEGAVFGALGDFHVLQDLVQRHFPHMRRFEDELFFLWV